jgi:hypothetical protein
MAIYKTLIHALSSRYLIFQNNKVSYNGVLIESDDFLLPPLRDPPLLADLVSEADLKAGVCD